MKGINALVMQSRADKNPGEWKSEPNRAGDTYFVSPSWCLGRCARGTPGSRL